MTKKNERGGTKKKYPLVDEYGNMKGGIGVSGSMSVESAQWSTVRRYSTKCNSNETVRWNSTQRCKLLLIVVYS